MGRNNLPKHGRNPLPPRGSLLGAGTQMRQQDRLAARDVCYRQLTRSLRGENRKAWNEATAEQAKRYLSYLFGLEAEDDSAQPAFTESLLTIVRREFIKTCLARKVTGMPGQTSKWYRSMLPSVQKQLWTKQGGTSNES